MIIRQQSGVNLNRTVKISVVHHRIECISSKGKRAPRIRSHETDEPLAQISPIEQDSRTISLRRPDRMKSSNPRFESARSNEILEPSARISSIERDSRTFVSSQPFRYPDTASDRGMCEYGLSDGSPHPYEAYEDR